MGTSASRALRNPVINYPIDKWTEKLDFIKEQIDTKGVNNSNIAGLQCTRRTNNGSEKITFRGSEFDFFSPYFKSLKPTETSSQSFINIFTSTPEHIFYKNTLEFSMRSSARLIPASIKSRVTSNKLNNNIKSTIASLEQDDLESISANFIELNRQFIEIYNLCKEGKTVCALNYSKYHDMYHATASVFWWENNNLHCGIYDPIYYTRETSNYIWAINTFAATMHLVGHNNKIPIKIHNFSEMCHITDRGIHCAQYLIDTEYCMVYALYFIYLYAAQGFPKTADGIQSVINSTFISDPNELKRNPCQATNRFRLIIMAFTMNAILCLTNATEIANDVVKVYETVSEDGYELLDTESLALAMSILETDRHYNNMRIARKRKYNARLASNNIQRFLINNPGYQLIRSPKNMVYDRKYKVLYRNRGNNTVKNYEGRHHIVASELNVATFKNNSNTERTFTFDNVVGIFQQKRRGGRKTRRLNR
jgi:hypothetical protein